MAATLWLTGLPGAGKTTLAVATRDALRARGERALVLDGDEVRRTLCADLGFDGPSRDENVRRCAAVAALATGAEVYTLVALVSPRRAAREAARAAHEQAGLRFIEVHLAAPAEVCEARDPKGLWARARAGTLPDFTGVSAPYEPPLSAELVVPAEWSVEASVEALLRRL